VFIGIHLYGMNIEPLRESSARASKLADRKTITANNEYAP